MLVNRHVFDRFPSHVPAAHKNAYQRWFIANLPETIFLFYMKWHDKILVSVNSHYFSPESKNVVYNQKSGFLS